MIRCEAEVVDPVWGLKPCDEEAIAMRLTDLDGEPPWPACDRHASPAVYLGDGIWRHP